MSPSPDHGARVIAARDPASDPIMFVYQMAKVASMSWVLLGREYFGISDPVHVHYMAPENLSFLRAQYEATGAGQTILRRLPLRNLLRAGDAARALLADARTHERPILAVTGVRDPVARSLSALFFTADFSGRSDAGLSWRDGAAAENVERAFIAMWDGVLGGEQPRDTFGRIVQFIAGAYRSWFESEMATVLGIDAPGASFSPGPARRILARGRIRALVYRVEDMSPGSPGHAMLRADVEALCGRAIPGFATLNATALRKSGDFYRSFLARFRMPARLLDRIYDDRAVQHFYSPQEIAGFRRRWLSGPQE